MPVDLPTATSLGDSPRGRLDLYWAIRMQFPPQRWAIENVTLKQLVFVVFISQLKSHITGKGAKII
jgi:hypothetical protein